MYRRLLPILAVLAGCESATGPEPVVDVVAGNYRLVEISGTSPFFGTPVSGSDGSLTMADGRYTMSYRIQVTPRVAPQHVEDSGTYTFSDLPNGVVEVVFSPRAERGRLNADRLTMNRGGYTAVWRRLP